ncbi:MAG TPA: hypothetical protein PLN05_03630 [Pyrinomonadaceae bacterium]|nr:hypothetical protein [Chloracidobacterium sp.]HRJ90313.1 hypothetical protein [Pyrinomonadaceae bacterium]HRK49511.1 hypothetical protein [Pyrinomonadaceae bacterium]
MRTSSYYQLREIVLSPVRGKQRKSGRYAVFVLSASVLFVSAFQLNAQTPAEIDTAPPPLKVISKSERDELSSSKGVKERTKTALEFMDVRLKNAELANSRGDLDTAFAELGAFHALMDDTLSFLGSNDKFKGRVLDNFKRFEIGLRRFTPRLELVRRELPLTHEFYVRSLLKQLRDARTKATEPLFGETVLRDG